jgi:hypothetical protein
MHMTKVKCSGIFLFHTLFCRFVAARQIGAKKNGANKRKERKKSNVDITVCIKNSTTDKVLSGNSIFR